MNTIIDKARNLVPEYLKSLQESNISKKEIRFINKKLIQLLESCSHDTDDSTLNQLSAKSINNYLVRQIPKNHPEYSKNTIVKIQTMIKKFIKYLTLQEVLPKKMSEEIFNNLYNKTELKREIDKTVEEINQEKFEEYQSDEDYSDEEYYEDHFDEKLEEILSRVNEWTIEFLNSTYSKSLTEKQIGDAEFIIETFADNMFGYFLFPPEKWDEQALEEVCVDIFPAKVTADASFFHSITPVLTHFFSFLSDKRVIRNALSLQMKLNEISKKIVENASNPKYWGPAKSMMMGSLKAGVDFNSEESLGNYLEDLPPHPDGDDPFLGDSLDVEQYISEIKPFTEDDPYGESTHSHLFNFPRGIKINIKNLVDFLQKILDADDQKKKFLKSNFDDYAGYFSDEIEKELMKEAERFYRAEKYRKAMAAINKLLKKCPTNAIALYVKGKILGDQKMHYNAFKFILKSLEEDPFKIEAFLDFSYLLQLGGYFHHSHVITALLVCFLPDDFDILVQMALNSYQLLKPFKQYLRVAGQLDPERLINFLMQYWTKERIEPRDGLEDINISLEVLNSIEKDADIVVSKTLKYLKG